MAGARPKWLVVGRSGQLATALARRSGADTPFLCLGRPALDLCCPDSLAEALDQVEPSIVINAAAWTAVDAAETAPNESDALNRVGPGLLARECARREVPLVHVSTDHVFDGRKDVPYTEADAVNPVNAYGRSKLAGEEAIRALQPRHVILRTAWLFGAEGGGNFVTRMLDAASRGERLRVVADQTGSPTWSGHLAEVIETVCLRVDADEAVWGTFHAAGSPPATRLHLARALFETAARHGFPMPRLTAAATADFPASAARPAYAALDSGRLRMAYGGGALSWREGLERCLASLLGGEDEGER